MMISRFLKKTLAAGIGLAVRRRHRDLLRQPLHDDLDRCALAGRDHAARRAELHPRSLGTT